MALNLPGIPQLFKHSKDFSQGLGKERKTGEFILSQDGTGDFASLREALNAMTAGGKLKIKNGTYLLEGNDSYSIPSNIVIEGEGYNTILKTSNSASYWINIHSQNNVVIRNLTFYIFAAAATEAAIDIDNSNNIIFEKVKFKPGDNNCDTVIWNSYGHTVTNVKFLNCVYDYSENDVKEGFSNCYFLKSEFLNNRFDTTNMSLEGVGNLFTNCIFKGNYFNHLYLEVGSNDNVAIGNQGDITDAGSGNQVGYNALSGGLGGQHKCRAYLLNTLSVANNTETPVGLAAEEFDTNTMHDLVTNNSRITIKKDGYYLLQCSSSWADNATGFRKVAIKLNNTTVLLNTTGQGTTGVFAGGSCVNYLETDDYIELVAYQNSGGALNLYLNPNNTFLSAVQLV